MSLSCTSLGSKPAPAVEAAGDASQLSRSCTLDAELNTLESIETAAPTKEIHNWSLRSTASNDFFLRESFNQRLRSSADLPPEERLIMYDACDDTEVRQQLGFFRKRIDARRNTKPKKPDAQLYVCTPFGDSRRPLPRSLDSTPRSACSAASLWGNPATEATTPPSGEPLPAPHT